MRLSTGLIGAHIGDTRLPVALKRLCDYTGMDLSFTQIDTQGDLGFDLRRTLDRLRDAGWTSVSVTHPHKTRCRDYIGRAMSADTDHLQACNTVRFKGALAGVNTDYSGFLAAWQNAFGDARPGKVVMVGAGGVAQAIGPALRDLGAARIAIFDSDPERAHALQTAIGPRARVLRETDYAKALHAADGVVNATPVGMAQSPGSAIDLSALAAGRQVWAFDAIYTPLWTPFLRAARQSGLQILTGFDLFQMMAVHSFNACTGLALADADALPLLRDLGPDK